MKNSTKLNDDLLLKSGFTFVEIAIVVTILAFLFGGVLAGQELIAQAKIRKVISELKDNDLAVSSFRNKYGGKFGKALPGDFNKASKIFTAETAFDGDGNGKLESAVERLSFWHHLSLAGMLKGEFSPVAYIQSENISDYNIEKFFPKSNSKGFYIPIYFSTGVYSQNNYLILADAEINGSDVTYKGILDNTELYSIDLKLDDAKPLSGKIRNFSDSIQFDHPCYQGDTYITEQDNASIKEFKCILLQNLNI